MARIADGVLKAWLDGAVVKATDYKQERDILRIAINDNYDTLILKYSKVEVDSLLTALQADVNSKATVAHSELQTHKTSTDHDTRYYPRLDIDGLFSSLKGAGYNNETLASLKADFGSLQTQLNNLNSIYSTDAERIAAINDVINQFQIADGNLNTLILAKADKSNVYTKTESDTTNQAQDARISTNENNIATLTSRVGVEEGKSSSLDSRVTMNENNIANRYTKSEVDASLFLKADKTNVYTKAEIDIFKAGQTVDSEVIQARLGSDGTAHAALKNRLDRMEGRQLDSDRVSANLLHGLQVVSSSLNSPVDFEIQGRTLISLGNSNLEWGKSYVLADKKTKIRDGGREGTLYSGVSKFAKGSQVVLTKADFTSKVSGSVTENAHISKWQNANSLLSPSNVSWIEVGASGTSYSKINSLNGTSELIYTISNGQYSQQIYSFNIIEQIERKMGRIPSDTVAGKVQWIKDNVQQLTADWNGWGSSVGGNGVTVAIWKSAVTTWINGGSHTNGTVTKLSPFAIDMASYVDSNGFFHILAYTTVASDGTTPSQLNTDYISLDITLKTTAILDTRPIITRVANFEDKISGSTVENSHVAKDSGATSLLVPSSGSFTEYSTTAYGLVSSLNGTVRAYSLGASSGSISQNLFSFDLIQAVERNIGRIPKLTLAEKVQWCKDNVDTLNVDWYGYGSSVGGNNATVSQWNGSAWVGAATNTTGAVVKVTRSVSTANVDANGFIHVLAYANASDGTTASTINTDYCELQITLKQGTTLFDPVLPLYEVDGTLEYPNILVSWDEANVLNRYPKVQGVQHLQNVAVMGEGENLLPPFSEWTLHANAKVNSPYELELNGVSSAYQNSYVTIPVVKGQTYYFQRVSGAGQTILHKGNSIANPIILNDVNGTYTVDDTYSGFVTYRVTNPTTGVFKFTNPMLNLGSTAKPFVPRNPSYLFAQTKLGQIGDKKDVLSYYDGQWWKRKLIEKDVVLDGSLAWGTTGSAYTGYKSFVISTFASATDLNGILVKYDGKKIPKTTGAVSTSGADTFRQNSGDSFFYLQVSNVDSGFGESYIPNSQEMSAVMYGWTAKTIDGNGKPTAWKSLGDGTDAPTQTIAYVSTTKAPNFTPYKLSYLLASPQTLNVTNLVEGAINVSGSTQVEVTSGVVVREKVTSASNGTLYYINRVTTGYEATRLKNKTEKIIAIYKNGILDKNWTITPNDTSNAYGKSFATIPNTLYDTTAIYEVTYLVLEREKQTNNATEVKAIWSGSIKDVVDTNAEKLTDLATQSSINTAYLYRLLIAAKAAGWSV